MDVCRRYTLVTTLVAVAILLAAPPAAAAEPKIELLWPDGAPGAKGDQPADKPTLTIYLAGKEKAVGTAVVHLSRRRLRRAGRGPRRTSRSPSGSTRMGVAGLHPRIPPSRQGLRPSGPAPRRPAGDPHRPRAGRRVGRSIRTRSASWASRPAGTWPRRRHALRQGRARADDPIDRPSCRPDFMILCYAVIAFGETVSRTTARSTTCSARTPRQSWSGASRTRSRSRPRRRPRFLFHTDEDTGVPAENSVQFYLALRRQACRPNCTSTARPARPRPAAQTPGTSNWPRECEDWLRGRGLLPPAAR